MTLTGARGGACLDGGRSHPSGVLRWINLLPVRGHLACLLPSWGGHLLLVGCGSCLMEARSSRSPWLSQSPTAPTDNKSGQQVLRSGGRKCVHRHRVNWRQSWWWVSRWRYPTHRGAGCGLGGRVHGCIAHHRGHPQCRSLTGSLVRYLGAPTLFADPKQRRQYFTGVILSSQFKTPTMSSWGQLTAT